MRSLLLTCFVLSIAPLPGMAHAAPATPHPAVARIVVPEQDGTAYGSGTLIDVREEYGLVLTNWHVVRDASGPIEVLFPSGFISQARSIKVDKEWDLAALVVWRPPCEPVKMATRPPRPGDALTICGYGSGNYRAITGRCTQFYAPRLSLPQELVELDVQARQGDSGGPIFNDRGELAGVLFGAGKGTTLGSFEGRVKTFLASLAPDIGQPAAGSTSTAPQIAMRPVTSPATGGLLGQNNGCIPQSDLGSVCFGCDTVAEHQAASVPQNGNPPNGTLSQREVEWPDFSSRQEPATSVSEAPTAEAWPRFKSDEPQAETTVAAAEPTVDTAAQPLLSANLFENIRNGLALVGVLAIVMQFLKLVG